MKTYWTLEYNGVEKTFADWKLSQVRTVFRSLEPDLMTARQTVKSIAAGRTFEFEGKVTVRRGREKASNGALSGGQIWFVGWRTTAPARGSGADQGFDYTFAGPLYLLEDMPYRQEWFSGVTTHVLLGIDKTGAYQKTGAVFADVIANAAAQGAPIQAGTIDAGLYVPIDEGTDMTCKQVMQQMARWAPDAVSFFDYSVTPPKLHFQRRGDLEALDIRVPIERTSGLNVTPRHDLQRDYCLILFERSVEEGGQKRHQVFPQIAPEGHPGTGRRGLVSTVNLQGPRSAVSEADVETAAFTPGAIGVLADPNAYWLERIPALQNGKWRNAKIKYVGAKDEAGEAVSVAGLGNELTNGSLSEGMLLEDGTAVTWKKVRVAIEITADHYDAAGEAGKLLNRAVHPHFIDRTLTNATTGTYTISSEVEPGEPLAQFNGMAAYMLSCTQELQYDGTYLLTDVGDLLSSSALALKTWTGKVVNLLGSDPDWAAMRALITQVDVNHDTQSVSLRFGPAPHLEFGDLITLTRNNRQRRRSVSTRVMTEGVASAQTDSVKLGQETREKQTHTQGPEYQQLIVKSTAKVDLNGAGTVTISADDATLGSIVIALAAANGKAIALRELPYQEKQADGSCIEKKVIVLASEVYE